MTKNTALRNLLADAFGGVWDGGKIQILDYSDPSVVLVEFSLEADAFGPSVSGEITLLGTPLQSIAIQTGRAWFARILSADASYELSGLTVTEPGFSGQVELDNTDIDYGQVVHLNDFRWIESA